MLVPQIDDWPGLFPTIEELGLRHVAYGVQPERYPPAGDALIRMLWEMLGKDFSPAAEIAWRQLYNDLSHTMIGTIEHRKSLPEDSTLSA